MADGGRHVPRTRVAIAVRGDGDARRAFPHGRGGDGDGDGSWGGDGRAVRIFFLGVVEQLYRMRFYLSVPRNHKLRRMRYKFNL